MQLLITRPEPDATLSAAQLSKLGYSVLISPALETTFSNQPLVWRKGMDLAVTSRNAMRALLALAQDEMRETARLYCVGDATAALGQNAGFKDVVSAAGTVEDLIALISDERPTHLLYVCGYDRKGNLETRLRAQGILVDMTECYKAEFARQFTPEALKALQTGTLDGVLFYSRRTAEAFHALERANDVSYSTKKITFFCLAKTVAGVFDSRSDIRLITAEHPDERALFEAITRFRADLSINQS